MTKKDYVKFAKMFRELLDSNENYPNRVELDTLVHDTIAKTARIFAEDNPRFNTVRFSDFILNRE